EEDQGDWNRSRDGAPHCAGSRRGSRSREPAGRRQPFHDSDSDGGLSVTRILVVEDEPGIAFALEADLRTEGYAVTVAATGDEALRVAVELPFDLILLDVMLPGKDGFEVCRTLRRSG